MPADGLLRKDHRHVFGMDVRGVVAEHEAVFVAERLRCRQLRLTEGEQQRIELALGQSCDYRPHGPTSPTLAARPTIQKKGGGRPICAARPRCGCFGPWS